MIKTVEEYRDIHMEQSDVVIFEWDILADTMSYSANWSEKLGFEPLSHDVSSRFISSPYLHPDDVETFISLLDEVQKGRLYATVEFRFLNAEKEYIWYRIHAVTQYDKDDRPISAIGIMFDIQEEIQMIEKLRSRAERDALTGLYNREETETRIRHYLETAPQQMAALFMIDTDNFKQVNDTKGHMLGDVVLTEMSSSMKSLMREQDVVGRIGGDEFTILMKDISSREDAGRKAEEMTEAFSHLFENEKMAVRVTCSIGIAFYPADGTDFHSLYRCADQALYQAKTQGKNRYTFYDSEQSLLAEDHEYSTLGTEIDSEHQSSGEISDLIRYVFRLLYRMDDMDQAINLILKIVGKRFDVSRAYIFENTEDGKYCSNTYEWCNEGIVPEIGNLQHMDYSQLGDYEKPFGEDSIFYCRDTSTLAPEQVELFERQGIHSTLQCAFWGEKKFEGFAGFDECTGVRLWTKEEVSALVLISQILTTFLQKRRMDEWNKAIKLEMQSVLDAQDTCVYIVDKETCQLLYINRKARERKPGIRPEERCHKAFFGREEPCEFCPICQNHLQDKRIHISPIQWMGNEAYLVSRPMLAAADQFETGEEMNEAEYRLAAEKSIVECIKWLTASDYLEDAIEYVLTVILRYYKSDRVYIIETAEERGFARNTYEICAEGVTPQKGNLQDVPIEVISFWMKQFEVREYVKIDDVDELGEDRRREADILKEQGISSLMAIPLHVKGEMKGFLGIDDPKLHKENFYYLVELSYFIENEISKNALRRSLERLSYCDGLTGLENRNSYTAYCDDYAKRLPAPTGVIFMDINGLKKLNDSKGHIYGDMLITHISDMMKQFFPCERKFRLSGDEFLIVTESVSYDVFRRQLDAMEEKLTEDGRCIIAVGTTWSDVEADLSELLNKADRLMYISKHNYYRARKDIAAEKIPMLQGLSESILNKEYLVYLQPKWSLKTGSVNSAEVLVRYREQDGSISSPIKFIPLLEREGLISSIDFFVLEEVCELLTRWKDTELSGMKLALNFSRITLFDERFFERFWDVFKRYDLNPAQLELEITETQESLNKKQMALLLDDLKKHGFRIALDDFGVEYSSYEFLMMARFDLIKIDKGIIQKYEGAQKGEILVKHIVDMAHDIGSACCAEGVETVAQYEYLKEIGCDYIQGYLIDRPLPADQFERKYG